MTKEELVKALTTFPGEWELLLEDEKNKDYYQKLVDMVSDRYLKETVYPPYNLVFHALSETSPKNVRAVILGQDPYYNEGQANGLSFSVNDNVALPKSLQNIYKELFYEYGYPIPKTGNLEPWAKQGVLLLNASLTVKALEPNSHAELGWANFTDDVIQAIDKLDQPVVYLLWGAYAQKKEALIHSKKACIIKTAHPSPLSAYRGFFCSDCFKRANQFLSDNKLDPIQWQIKDTH